jgi:hypothetical protein
LARLIPANCPRCGAGLHVDAGRDQATCPYCGLTSFVEHEGAPPRVDLAPEVMRIIVSRAQASQARRSGGAGCAVAIAGIVVAIVGGIVAVVVARVGSTTKIGSGLHVGGGVKLTASDLHHMDLADVIRQARTAALAMDSHARLTMAVAHETADGLLDATTDNPADVTYAYRYEDRSKPPGKDLVAGEITFAVYGGEFRVVQVPSAAVTESSFLEEPKCSSASAWQTAVKSGVPSNAHASIILYDNRVFSPKSPVVWSVRVEGHDEDRREIDAMTCVLVKSWKK